MPLQVMAAKRSISKLGNNQNLKLFRNGAQLVVIFNNPNAKKQQTIPIPIDPNMPEIGMWMSILNSATSGSHVINQGTLVPSNVEMTRLMLQLSQSVPNSTIGIQNDGNPALNIGIKGRIKMAQFRISPNGMLPGGRGPGGAEFRIEIGGPYLTFDGQRSTYAGDTHFWLGPQGSNADWVQAMMFTILDQYYQTNFSSNYP